MASFEVFVPPLDNYEELQEAFAIEPEELALLGLNMVGQVPDKYVKTCGLVPDYGYVMPYTHQGRPHYLRGLYLHENEIADVIGIPRRPEELGTHLKWYRGELDRLKAHGITAAAHIPVIVKDEDRWGEAGYGIFTLAETVMGTPLEKSLKSHLPGRQKPALEAIRKLFGYYQDPNRPADGKPIRDICFLRQYLGHCLIDIDPLDADPKYLNELAYLSAQAAQLCTKEGKELGDAVRSEWLYRLSESLKR